MSPDIRSRLLIVFLGLLFCFGCYQNEANRIEAEKKRAKAEGERDVAEGDRDRAEGDRERAERERDKAEGGRQTGEKGRQSAEKGRQASEEERKEAERLRTIGEARQNLKRIASNVVSYYQMDRYSTAGVPLPRAFPASVELTPAKACCEVSPDGLCPAVTKLWLTDGWKNVKFEVREPHAFQYEMKTTQKNPQRAVVIRATGRPGCEGKDVLLETYVGLQEGQEVFMGPIIVKGGKKP